MLIYFKGFALSVDGVRGDCPHTHLRPSVTERLNHITINECGCGSIALKIYGDFANRDIGEPPRSLRITSALQRSVFTVTTVTTVTLSPSLVTLQHLL